MKIKRIPVAYIVIGLSLFVIAAVVISFVTLQHQGYFTKAELITNLPSALPGSEVNIQIDALQSVDVATQLDDPLVQKLEMRNYHGELEIDVHSIGSTSATPIRGTADKAQLSNNVLVGATDNGLEFTSGGVTATTIFPLMFSKTTGQLAVESSGNFKYLRILPDRAREISRSIINGDIDKIELVVVSKENSGDDLIYKITGKKTGNLMGIYPSEVNVEVQVGAQSGVLLNTNEPVSARFFIP